MNLKLESKDDVVPGTVSFIPVLRKFHQETARLLDERIRTGGHEPGHGAAHLEMALFMFFRLSKIAGLSQEKEHLGALAIILHDIWREIVYESHVTRSAARAREVMDCQTFVDEQGMSIPESLKEIVVLLVKAHSINSQRVVAEEVPAQWLPAMKTVQYADIFSASGPIGYLRGFSYSGHVLKSLLGRIRKFATDPTRYQLPVPCHLRRLLSETNNHFHAWALSIMLKTNRSYVEKLSDNVQVITKQVALSIKLGFDPTLVEQATGIRVDTSDGATRVNLFEQGDGAVVADSPLNMQTLRKEHTRYVAYFDELISDLDELAAQGLRGPDAADTRIVDEVLGIMRHGMIGLCSRVFWNQFNPTTDESNDQACEYLTLDERIERSSRLALQESPAKLGIRTARGSEVFEKSCGYCDELVTAAQKQLRTQRWTVDMWDRLAAASA